MAVLQQDFIDTRGLTRPADPGLSCPLLLPHQEAASHLFLVLPAEGGPAAESRGHLCPRNLRPLEGFGRPLTSLLEISGLFWVFTRLELTFRTHPSEQRLTSPSL